MTDHRDPALASRPRPAPPGALAVSLAFAWRSLLKLKHVPEQLGDVIGIPILFTLMFTYLFGGLPPPYLFSHLPPLFTYGVTLNRDLATGAFDRFRSMPVWRPGPIVGGLIGDTGRYPVAAGLVIALGLVMVSAPVAARPASWQRSP